MLRKGSDFIYNNQLETFIRVADSGSFSKAAELLYVSPNAIIKQINLLESQLNLRLFIRTHRGITLTLAGKSLYKDAKYIIQYSKDSINRAKKEMQSAERTIRIGTSLMTPTQFLVDIWPQIHTHCPGLKFKLVPFENTPENAREIMMNFGQNIDLVAGIYAENLNRQRKCDGLKLSDEPICCALSSHHRLADKEVLKVSDLFDENLMIIHREWNSHVDSFRDSIEKEYPQINVVDFSFYGVDIFNHCAQSNDILMAVKEWENVHPMLKIIPVEWDYVVPFGLVFSPEPSNDVRMFIQAVTQVYDLDK